MPLLTLGLCGLAGVGKDEVASYLVSKHGFASVEIAKPIKDALYALNPLIHTFGLDHNQDRPDLAEPLQGVIDQYGWDATKRVLSEARQLLQRFGTECLRNVIDPLVLERKSLEWIAFHHANGLRVVVKDIRLPSESTLCRYLCLVDRPEQESDDPHPTENVSLLAERADLYCANSGTLEELHEAIDEMLAEAVAKLESESLRGTKKIKR